MNLDKLKQIALSLYNSGIKFLFAIFLDRFLLRIDLSNSVDNQYDNNTHDVYWKTIVFFKYLLSKYTKNTSGRLHFTDDEKLIFTDGTLEKSLFFKIDSIFFYYHREIKNDGTSSASSLFVFPKSSSKLLPLLNREYELYKKSLPKVLSIYQLSQGFNSRSTVMQVPLREEQYYYIDEEIKNKVFSELDNFLLPETEEWYKKNGINYKYNMMLEGEPGVGKTTMIRILATRYKKEILVFSFGKNNIEQITVNELKNKILVIEDIDAVESSTQKRENTEDLKKTISQNLSTLLNFLDGLSTPQGLICIMTTNYLQHLDKALIRPGRVDALISLGLPRKIDFYHMFINFFEGRYLEHENEFTDYCVNNKFTIPKAQQVCFQYKHNFDKFMEKIDAVK